jgi:Fe-S oxidoreductase
MGECGHAFRSVYDMGNRWLGWRMPPIPVVHAIDFYYELIKDKKIMIAEKIKAPVTLHDPCNVIRGGGLAEKARYVVNAICEQLIEMHPNREHNYCPRTQLLLRCRRWGHQLRAAIQKHPHARQPNQG